jgi:short-subunit dehydrogenase
MNVVIIGATTGIGREMARQYAQKGWKVGATGRRIEMLETLKSEFPNQIFTKKQDVASGDNLLIINQLAKEMGGFDVFIYNSGFGQYNRDLDFKIEKTTIDVNLVGFVECAGWAYNFLKKQGHGTLVGISSIAGERGHFRAPAYNATKAFVSNYLQGLHAKAHKENRKLSVVDIRPGFVLTPMTEQNKEMFWVATVEKAAKQIISAIENRKKVAYITRRWALVAFALRNLPAWVYRTI